MVRDDASDAAVERTNYTERRSMTGHKKSISAVKFSPDGTCIATASADKTVHLWDCETGTLRGVVQGHSAGVNDLAWSNESHCISTASDDRTVQIFDVRAKYSSIKKLSGHTNYVFCVNYNTYESKQIVSGSFDESVRIFDLRSGGTLRVLPAHADPVTAVHFSKDGRNLLSASYDGNIRIWDAMQCGKLIKTISDESNTPVSAAQFTPNGTYILAGTLDDSLRIYDVKTAKTIKTYAGIDNDHEKTFINRRFCIAPTHVVNHPDSNHGRNSFVATGSENGKIFLWHLQTKRIAQVIDAHQDTVTGVAEHPTRSLLASVSVESALKVKIWDTTSATAM